MIAAWLIVTSLLAPAARADDFVIDPLGRHAKFALACGRTLRGARAWTKPRVVAAAAWTKPKLVYVADRSMAAAGHGVSLALQGSLEARLAHNRAEILRSLRGVPGQDPSQSQRAEVLLKTTFKQLYPTQAEAYRILFRDVPLELFVEDDVRPTLFAPHTPVLARWSDELVAGKVSREVIARLVEQARRSRE